MAGARLATISPKSGGKTITNDPAYFCLSKVFNMTGAKYGREERSNLIKLAEKIKVIPQRFVKFDGTLDLDKIHLLLQDYQRNKYIPRK